MQMKKTVALFLIFCLLMGTSFALAADYPFKPDVNYHQKYTENGAKASMLNFGCARLAPGEDLYDADKITIKKMETEKVEQFMDEGRMFYNYAKWRAARAYRSCLIEAMLVLTDPEGNYYATYGEWEMGRSSAKAVYSWFFDVTDCLRRCREEHDGSLPKGEYAFSLFFNDKVFRVNKVTLF